MKKQNKAMAKAMITVLANFSGIGLGIAIYEQRWVSLIAATMSVLVMLCLAWRSENDSD